MELIWVRWHAGSQPSDPRRSEAEPVTSRAPVTGLFAQRWGWCPDTAHGLAFAGLPARSCGHQPANYKAGAFARQPGAYFIQYHRTPRASLSKRYQYATAALYATRRTSPTQPHSRISVSAIFSSGNHNFWRFYTSCSAPPGSPLPQTTSFVLGRDSVKRALALQRQRHGRWCPKSESGRTGTSGLDRRHAAMSATTHCATCSRSIAAGVWRTRRLVGSVFKSHGGTREIIAGDMNRDGREDLMQSHLRARCRCTGGWDRRVALGSVTGERMAVRADDRRGRRLRRRRRQRP